MGYVLEGMWLMAYCGFIGYGLHFPANQLGGPKNDDSISKERHLSFYISPPFIIIGKPIGHRKTSGKRLA